MLWMLLIACAGVEIAPDAVVLTADGEELWRCEGEEVNANSGEHSLLVECKSDGGTWAQWFHDFDADDWVVIRFPDGEVDLWDYDSDFDWDPEFYRVTGWAEGVGPTGSLYLLTFDVVAD